MRTYLDSLVHLTREEAVTLGIVARETSHALAVDRGTVRKDEVKPAPVEVHKLANENEVVTFTINGDAATISRVVERWLRRTKCTTAHARAEYRRFLRAGYWVW